jgi:hypothetical protein
MYCVTGTERSGKQVRRSERDTVEIGKPVKAVPPPAGGFAGRYAEIYAQVDKLEVDDWLPITCGTKRQAHRLRECAKLQKYKVKRRGTSVYIARNPGYSEPLDARAALSGKGEGDG